MLFSDLILCGCFMPLFDEEMFDHLWQTGQHLRKALLVPVLFNDVEEPMVKVFFIRILKHFGYKDIFAWIPVEHID